MRKKLNYWRMLLRSAFEALMSQWFRSLLTALGVIIGVSSVIMVISVGEGSKQKILSQIETMGSNLLVVNPLPQSRVAGSERKAFRIEDGLAIKEKLSEVDGVSVEVYGEQFIEWANKGFRVPLLGASYDFLRVRNFQLKEGRWFNENEANSALRICVLGAEIAKKLFGNTKASGKRIKIKGHSFEVIGVFKSKGGFGWFNPDQMVFVPIKSAQEKILGTEDVHSICVRIKEREKMQEAKDEIIKLLRIRHHIPSFVSKDELGFNVLSQEEIVRLWTKASKTFSALLISVASVSLLVGGIGIMNILLVSVAERVPEIGIRKAVGAKRMDILNQFLVESVLVSLLGASVGIIFGILGASLISKLSDWNTIIRWWSILVGVGFAILVGILFGIYPAWRAGKLDPVEALRRE